MTNAIDASETIAAPADRVWAVLTDWSGMSRWMPGAEELRGPTPPKAGGTLTFTARGAERTSTITELDPGRALTLTSRQGPVTAHYRYRLDPAGDTTRASLVADIVVHGPLRLLAPTIRRSIAKEDGGQLAALKRVVEAQAAPTF